MPPIVGHEKVGEISGLSVGAEKPIGPACHSEEREPYFNPTSPLGLLSLDHLIRPVQHRLRDCDADLFRGLEIEHEFELHRLLHGKIGGLGSLQDSVHVIGDAPVAFRFVRPVVHEPTGLYSLFSPVHRR